MEYNEEDDGLRIGRVGRTYGYSNEEGYGLVSLDAYKNDNWEHAIQDFEILESCVFSEASIALGQLKMANDKESALKHFRKAADAGVAEGAWEYAAILGHEYIADITGKDKEWYKYCLLAAQNGCGDAMNELGNYYSRKNDHLAAFYWYLMAEYYEYPGTGNSASAITKKYLDAKSPQLSTDIDGVRPKDVANVTSIFRVMTGKDRLEKSRMDSFVKAAMEDDNEIMGLFIGHFFEDFAKNDGNSRFGYRLAAHNNSIIGMKCFADMLAAGKGGEQNLQAAFDWYNRAAHKGEKTSCFIMGEFYRKSNPNLAAYWYSAALRRGYNPALQRMLQVL